MSAPRKCAESSCATKIQPRIVLRCGGAVVATGSGACGCYFCDKHLVGLDNASRFCRVCFAKRQTVLRMKQLQEEAGIYGLSREERLAKLRSMPPEQTEALFRSLMDAAQDWQHQSDRRDRPST